MELSLNLRLTLCPFPLRRAMIHALKGDDRLTGVFVKTVLGNAAVKLRARATPEKAKNVTYRFSTSS